MSHSTPEMKICTKCNNELPATLEYFPKRDNHLHSWCRTCKLAYNNEWRHKNPERDAAHKQKWNENNPEKLEEKRKRYYAENREWYLEYSRNHHKANRDKKIEQTRAWQKANPDRKRAAYNRYYAKKRGLDNSFTPEEWQTCLEHFNFCCAYCGAQRGFWNPMCMEHFIPVSSSGGFTKENIVPACKSCNSQKHDKPADEFLIAKYGKRKAKEILKRVQAYFDSL